MITLHVNTQPAFMLVVIRLSPILPPPLPSLFLSLSHSSQLLWARIYHGKQSIRGNGDEQADCTYVAPSLSVIVTIDFSFSGSLSIEMCHTFLETINYPSK